MELERTLLDIYVRIPAQLVGVILLLAAGGFGHIYIRVRRGAPLYILPQAALAITVGFVLLASFYMLVVPLPISLAAKAGVLRLMMVFLGIFASAFGLGVFLKRDDDD